MSNKIATAIAAAALAVPAAQAAENPFQMVEFGAGTEVAAKAKDMQGNDVMIEEATGFFYGGDQTGAYAGGKIATGVKDPDVCGTYKSEVCSMAHLPGSSSYKK